MRSFEIGKKFGFVIFPGHSFQFMNKTGERLNIAADIAKASALVARAITLVENGAKTPDWMGEANILTSGHVFLAAAYLAVCYSLSRYSRRLEAKR